MSYYPCKPNGTIKSNPQSYGFYKCWLNTEEEKIPTYLSYFVIPNNDKETLYIHGVKLSS